MDYRMDWDQWRIVGEDGAPVAAIPDDEYELYNLMYWRVREHGHEVLISQLASTWEEAQQYQFGTVAGWYADLLVQGYGGAPYRIFVATAEEIAARVAERSDAGGAI